MRKYERINNDEEKQSDDDKINSCTVHNGGVITEGNPNKTITPEDSNNLSSHIVIDFNHVDDPEASKSNAIQQGERERDDTFFKEYSTAEHSQVGEDSKFQCVKPIGIEQDNKFLISKISEIKYDEPTSKDGPTPMGEGGDGTCDVNESINMINFFSNLFSEKRDKLMRGKDFFVITEKEEVKDMIGFHKVYEILYLSKTGEREIKCFRRYDNFYKLNSRIKKKYPFITIPQIPPKNPLAKLITVQNEFYENRLMQLNFYLNYILHHPILSRTKEFWKFLHDTKFDEEYFLIEENLMNNFPNSLRIADTMKNKFYDVFTNLFGVSNDSRIITDKEILIKKAESHCRSVIERYIESKNNIVVYLRTVKLDSDGYKQFSATCFYLKDTFENATTFKQKFQRYYEQCLEASNTRNMLYQTDGRKLEHEFEAFISLVNGVCDACERYSQFLNLYELVHKAHNYARSTEMSYKITSLLSKELFRIEELKNLFDNILTQDVTRFAEVYKSTYDELIDEFKILLK